jgi:hypothetical protein
MASLGFFKIGTDVFENTGGGTSRAIAQDEFQNLGINFNLLGEGLQGTKVLGDVRDQETQQFLASGGQLGQPNAAVNAGFAPIAVPPTVPAPTLAQAAGTIPQDTLAAFQTQLASARSSQQKTFEDLLAALNPSPELLESQNRLLSLQQLQQQGVEQAQERGLTGAALRGAVASEISDISTGETRESLVNLRQQTFEAQNISNLLKQQDQNIKKLDVALQQGQANIDNIFQAAQFQQQVEESYFNRIQALTSQTRANLGVILERFQGLTLDQLSPQDAAVIGQMAQQLGLPLDIIAQGMQVLKSQIDIENAQNQFQLETSRINALKRDEEKTTPLSILDIARYNELYPEAGIVAGDTEQAANEKVAALFKPRNFDLSDGKTMGENMKNQGLTLNEALAEVDNDSLILNKEEIKNAIRGVYGVKSSTPNSQGGFEPSISESSFTLFPSTFKF